MKCEKLEKIRNICFFVGIGCGVVGFLIAGIYYIAIILTTIGIITHYCSQRNKKEIELIIQKIHLK